MFEAFKNFVAELTEGGKHPSQFDDNDYRLSRRPRCWCMPPRSTASISAAERDKLHA